MSLENIDLYEKINKINKNNINDKITKNQNKLKKNKNIDKKDLLLSSVFFSTAIAGEIFQELSLEKIIDYNFIYGYLSDFSSSAFFTQLYFMINKDSSYKTNIALSLTLPTIWSVIELSHKYLPTNFNTYDPLDIVSYYLGASVALGSKYILEKYL